MDRVDFLHYNLLMNENLENIKSRILSMIDQCQAYSIVIPSDNQIAQKIVDQMKNQLNSTLAEIEKSESLEIPKDAPEITPREFQILELLAQGHPNKELAYQLDISPKTVQFHIKNLFTKLEAGSRTEVVAKAIALGILKV